MAKSGKPRVSVLLLGVLVAAVSVTVAAGGAASMVAESFKKFTLQDATKALEETKKVVEGAKEVIEVALKVKDGADGDDDEERSAAGDGSTKLVHNDHFPRLNYVRVTDIKVGDDPALFEGSLTLDINPDGSGGVLVSTNFPLTFLSGEAYQQLKRKVSDGRVVAKSDLGGEVDQPCYAGGTPPQPITVVFDGGDEMKVEADKCWYKQSDGSMCLAVLPSPWATGETIIGTMLQTGVKVGADELTFQKSTKVGSGSGSAASSKSNTAGACCTKPFLSVFWLLVLLAYTVLL